MIQFLNYLQHFIKCTATYTLSKTNKKSVSQYFVYEQFDLVLSSLQIHLAHQEGRLGLRWENEPALIHNFP